MLAYNNPGNLRYSPRNIWKGLANPPFVDNGTGPFCVFTEPLYGVRAMMIVIAGYKAKHGIGNLEQLINVWAPPTDDNPVANYIEYVSDHSGYSPTQPIDLTDPDTLCQIVPAIIAFENGPTNVHYLPSIYPQAAALALS